jgi:hypothetical protein
MTLDLTSHAIVYTLYDSIDLVTSSLQPRTRNNQRKAMQMDIKDMS